MPQGEPAAAITVANYIDYATTTSFYGYNAQITVTQSFHPNTAYFYGCTLADGAMLDLSTQPSNWDGLTLTLDTSSSAQDYYLRKLDDGLCIKFNATIIFMR